MKTQQARKYDIEGDGSEGRDEFITLSERIVEYGQMAGVRIVPYCDPQLPYFSILPSTRKQHILDHLRSKVAWLENAEREGASFKSNRQMLWHAIRALNMVPCSDLMGLISDEDIIEIHTLDDITQIYHSFNFYEKSSYTIEELCSNTWQTLYSTDESTDEAIVTMIKEMAQGQHKETKDHNIPKYVVSELRSAFKYDVEIKHKMGSPLYDQMGRPSALVSIESLEVISQSLTAEQEEELLDKHFQAATAPTPLQVLG